MTFVARGWRANKIRENGADFSFSCRNDNIGLGSGLGGPFFSAKQILQFLPCFGRSCLDSSFTFLRHLRCSQVDLEIDIRPDGRDGSLQGLGHLTSWKRRVRICPLTWHIGLFGFKPFLEHRGSWTKQEKSSKRFLPLFSKMFFWYSSIKTN